MKAVLTYSTMIDGKNVEHTRIFDTKKAKKICGIKNGFGNEVKEIFITEKGMVFVHRIYDEKLEIPDQKEIKKRIGEHEPDKYIKFFGEVEEG